MAKEKEPNEQTDPKDGSKSVPGAVEEVEIPKTVVNTKKTVELVDAGSDLGVGVGATQTRAARRISYSGGADDIMADKSAIVEGKHPRKSGSVKDKMVDSATDHIDNVPAETEKVKIYTIPQLGDKTDSKVMYNGHFENAHKISQKGSGGSPASKNFHRTLEECQFDMCYFAGGQVNAVDAEDKQITITDYSDDQIVEKSATLGNYLLRKVTVTFNSNRKVEDVDFDVEDVTGDLLKEHEARAAGDWLIRSRNKYAKDRLSLMQNNGYDEDPKWLAMARAISNARGWLTLIGELEKTINDFRYLSGAKYESAFAYQHNKAAKDGLRRVGPMFEMTEGNCEGSPFRFKDCGFDGDTEFALNQLFAHRYENNRVVNPMMAKGSSAMVVAINDSVAKYTSKGRLLATSQAMKNPLTTLYKHRKQGFMHESFYNEYNRCEVFGKVDADPTGLEPVFITDGAGLIFNLNIFDPEFAGKDTIDAPIATLQWEDIRNPYELPIWNYFIAGIKKYIAKRADKICDQLSQNGQGKYVWEIPVVSSTTVLSMWDALVCAAANDIEEERTYAMQILFDLINKSGRADVIHGLKSLGDIQNWPAANIGYSAYSEPLKQHVVPIEVAARILLSEQFWVRAFAKDDAIDGAGGNTNHYGTIGLVVLPAYFNQNQFMPVQRNSGKNKVWEVDPDHMNVMTFFDYRGGAQFANAERLHNMDPFKLKLCLDRMVVPPAPEKQIDTLDASFDVSAFKYDETEDGIPQFLYYVASADADDDSHRLTIRDILKAPRELGLSFIAPAGVITPAIDDGVNNYRDLDSAYFVVSGPSFRIRSWSVTPLEEVGNELFDTIRKGNMAYNMQAHYYTIYALPDYASTDIGIVLTANVGSGLSLVDERIYPSTIVKDNGTFSYETGRYSVNEVPVARAGESEGDGGAALKTASVVSLNKYHYTRLNYLPFVINPFDVNTKKFTGGENTNSKTFSGCNNYDIFDFLHLFNLCGFRAGEYDRAAYDRDESRNTEGMNYVSDPYIEARGA